MTFDDIVTNHSGLTLGDLDNAQTAQFFDLVTQLSLNGTFSTDTLVKDVPALLDSLPPNVADALKKIEIQPDSDDTPDDIESSSSITAPPAVEDLKAISAISPREGNGRLIIGSLFCLVMAFTVIVFTCVVCLVAIHRWEFPSATLSAIIIIPTGYVAWYYMGIINKERRDILSALVGNKISPSAIAAVVEAIKNRK